MAKSEPTPSSIPCKIDENVWTEKHFFGCILGLIAKPQSLAN